MMLLHSLYLHRTFQVVFWRVPKAISNDQIGQLGRLTPLARLADEDFDEVDLLGRQARATRAEPLIASVPVSETARASFSRGADPLFASDPRLFVVLAIPCFPTDPTAAFVFRLSSRSRTAWARRSSR